MPIDPGDSLGIPRRKEHRTLAIVFALIAAAALGFSLLSEMWLYNGATLLRHTHEVEGQVPIVTVLSPVHEVGYGLRSAYTCPAVGDCERVSNAELVRDYRRNQLVARFMLHEDVEAQVAEEFGATEAAALGAERIAADENAATANDGGARQLRLVAESRVYRTGTGWVTLGWITTVLLALAALSLVVAGVLALRGQRVAWPVMPTTTAFLGIALGLIFGCVFASQKPGPPGYVGVGFGFAAFGLGVVFGLWSSVMLARLLRPTDPDLLEDAMSPEQF
jgi:hypothetical protein